MEQEAARVRELVSRTRPARPTDGYPAWVRREVVRFTEQARQLGWSWEQSSEELGLATTTVRRWVERGTALLSPQTETDSAPAVAAAPAPVTMPAPAPTPAPVTPPAVEAPPTTTGSAPAVGEGAEPGRATPIHVASASTVASAPRRKQGAGRVVPVPVIAVPDSPDAGRADRAGGSSRAAVRPGGLACSPPGSGGLWLQIPGGFQLHGLDLSGALALLQALR
jgi:hypothetical protein